MTDDSDGRLSPRPSVPSMNNHTLCRVRAAVKTATRLTAFAAASLVLAAMPRTAAHADGPAVTQTAFHTAMQAYDHRDFDVAFTALLPLAEAGDPRAQRVVGQMLRSGKGVTRNFAAAAHWYERAADQEDAAAQTKLGLAYAYGRGVPRNASAAFTLFSRAAYQGDGAAQVRVADAYAAGQGVLPNATAAYIWYVVAATHPDACPCLHETVADLAANLTPGALLEADRSVRRLLAEIEARTAAR